jgi:hypothetical protein
MTTATMPSTNNIKPVKRTWFKVQAATVLSLLLATCTSPSYATVNKCTNYIDLVAVHSNNATQELRNLLKTVQHRTIADVFLCLSFASLSLMGKLRYLAIVLSRYGEEDMEISLLLGKYRVPFVFSGFEPPYRPNLRANIKTSLPFEKV